MSENLVSSLFNRVVLDMIIGFLAIGLVQMAAAASGVDVVRYVTGSSIGAFVAIVLAVAGYLLGTFVDRCGYFICDRWLFRHEFSQRRSNFELPAWCADLLEKRIAKEWGVGLSEGPSVAEPGSDWISGLFLVLAPTDTQGRRRDLIANYQFLSNLLVIAIVAIPVLPYFLLAKGVAWPMVLLLVGASLSIAALLRQFCIVAARRLHTFENLIVYGRIVATLAGLDSLAQTLSTPGDAPVQPRSLPPHLPPQQSRRSR